MRVPRPTLAGMIVSRVGFGGLAVAGFLMVLAQMVVVITLSMDVPGVIVVLVAVIPMIICRRRGRQHELAFPRRLTLWCDAVTQLFHNRLDSLTPGGIRFQPQAQPFRHHADLHISDTRQPFQRRGDLGGAGRAIHAGDSPGHSFGRALVRSIGHHGYFATNAALASIESDT